MHPLHAHHNHSSSSSSSLDYHASSYSRETSPFSSRDHLLSDHHHHHRAISEFAYVSPLLEDNGNENENERGLGVATSNNDNDTATRTQMAWFTIRCDTPDWPNPRSRRKMSKQRRMALFRSYGFDWMICIVLAAAFFALDEIPGFKRQFSIEDTSLRYPYAVNERVPATALYFIAFVAPIVIQIVVNFLTVRSLWDFHNSSLGLLLSLALTGAVTQFTKVTVGRPRPDVISRCQPPPGVTNPEYKLVTVEICQQLDTHIIRDGFRSFPSGHSSLSFAGLGFLSFYLAGKMHLFDEKGHTTKAWISLAPLAGAALVAISRTMDYRHHWQDVLIGSFLGLFFSFFAYRQYYPPLSSPYAHCPFSPRIRREESKSGNPSEESQAPILPTVRPGVGGRTSSAPGGMGGGGGGGDGAYDRTEILTHPSVPHMHPIHSGHPPRDQYGGSFGEGTGRRAYGGVEVEDLQRGLGKNAVGEQDEISISVERQSNSDEVELSGPYKPSGRT